MLNQPRSISEETVGGFKGKAREFWALWESLNNERYSISQLPLNLQKEYSDIMERGETIRKSIERMTSVVDSVSNAYSSSVDWTSRKMETVFNMFGTAGQLGHLGVPLIPIAVVALSLAAIGKWITDALVVQRKIQLFNRLVASGTSPERASAVVNETTSDPFFKFDAKKMIPIIGVIALIGFLISRRR